MLEQGTVIVSVVFEWGFFYDILLASTHQRDTPMWWSSSALANETPEILTIYFSYLIPLFPINGSLRGQGCAFALSASVSAGGLSRLASPDVGLDRPDVVQNA